MTDTVATDPARMHHWADTIRAGRDFLNGAVATLQQMSCPTVDDFGSTDVVAAFGEFRDAWTAEITVDAGAIDQTATAIDNTADAMAAVEAANAANISATAPR